MQSDEQEMYYQVLVLQDTSHDDVPTNFGFLTHLQLETRVGGQVTWNWYREGFSIRSPVIQIMSFLTGKNYLELI